MSRSYLRATHIDHAFQAMSCLNRHVLSKGVPGGPIEAAHRVSQCVFAYVTFVLSEAIWKPGIRAP